MADSPAPAAAPPTPAQEAPNQKLQVRQYKLPWEAVGPFTVEEIFIKGTVRGKIMVADGMPVVYRSLIGEEVDKVNEGIKITSEMTLQQFKTEQTYWNLAFSVESVGKVTLSGTFEEKLAAIRKMNASAISRIGLGYLEFCGRIEDLFEVKGGGELAKKS